MDRKSFEKVSAINTRNTKFEGLEIFKSEVVFLILHYFYVSSQIVACLCPFSLLYTKS